MRENCLIRKLNRKMIRRSIVAKSFINKNKKIIETDIKYARPELEFQLEYKKVIGKIAKVDIEPETLIKFSMIKNK